MSRKNIFLLFLGIVVCTFFQVHTAKAQSVSYDYGETAKAILDDNGTLTITGEDSISAAGNIANAIGEENTLKVKKLIIDGNITQTYSYNFAAMQNLTEVIVGDNIVYMAENTFENCNALETIVLGAGIEHFHVSGKVQKVLKEVQVSPENPYLTVVGGVLFSKDMKELVYYPISLEADSYSIPDTVKTIGSYAFRYVSNLGSIEIPDSVTTISSHAFEYTEGIDELVIPESVDTLDYGSFMFAGAKKIIYNGTANPPERCFDSCDQMTTLEITSNQVDEIGNYTACESSNLEEVHLPNSVKYIGANAFDNCYALKYINVPDNLTKIGAGAFYRCGLLKDFTFPRSIVYIGSNAFEGTQITARPWWLTALGDGSYSTCISINYTGTVDYDAANALLIEINKERKNNGCPELKPDDSLNAGAVTRAEDLPVEFSYSRLDMTDGLNVSDKAEKQLLILSTTIEGAVNCMKRDYGMELKTEKYVSCGIACFYQGNSKYYSILLSSKDAVNTIVKTGKQYVQVNRNCEFNIINKDNFTVPGELSIEVGKSKQVVTGIKEYYANCILKLNPDSFKYDTSDHMVATVDENGRITGHSAGECTLFIYSNETKQWNQQYTVTVTGEGNDGYVDTGNSSGDSQEQIDEQIPEEPEEDEETYYNSLTDFYVTGTYLYKEAFEHLQMLNELREQEGVEPLVMDKQLLETAMMRSVECLMLYDHIRPCGETLRDLCSYADGENIAMNGSSCSPSVALNEFYNDIPHRENMLSARWKSVGIGVFVQNGKVYYIQDFSEDETHEEILQPEDESMQVSLKIPCKTGYVTRDRLIYEPTGTMKIGDIKNILIETYNFTYDEWGTSMGIVPDNKTFQFVNKTPDIVDVDEDGAVTAKATGNWKIIAKLPSNSNIQIVCTGTITEYGSGYDIPLTEEEYNADMNLFLEAADEKKPDDSNNSSAPTEVPPKQEEDNDNTGNSGNNTEGNNENNVDTDSNQGDMGDNAGGDGSQSDTEDNVDSDNNQGNTGNNAGGNGNQGNTGNNAGGNGNQGNTGNNAGGNNDNASKNPNENTTVSDNYPNDIKDDYENYAPSKVKKLKIKNKKSRKFKVSWQEVADADAYQIQYARNKRFTKGKYTEYAIETTCTIKYLSWKKTYCVRVRAFSINSDGNKIYGKWSAIVRKKVKK